MQERDINLAIVGAILFGILVGFFIVLVMMWWRSLLKKFSKRGKVKMVMGEELLVREVRKWYNNFDNVSFRIDINRIERAAKPELGEDPLHRYFEPGKTMTLTITGDIPPHNFNCTGSAK